MANRDVGLENKVDAKQVDPKSERRITLLRKFNEVIELYRTGGFDKNERLERLIILRKELHTIFEKKLSEQITYFLQLKHLINQIANNLELLGNNDNDSIWNMRNLFRHWQSILHTLMFPIEIASRLDESKLVLHKYGGHQNLLFQFLQLPLLARHLNQSFFDLPEEKKELENQEKTLLETSFGTLSANLPSESMKNIFSYLDYKGLLKLRATSKKSARWHSHFLFQLSCELPPKFVSIGKCQLDITDLEIPDIASLRLNRSRSTILKNGNIAAVAFNPEQSFFICCLWDDKTGHLIKKSNRIDIGETISSNTYLNFHSNGISFILNTGTDNYRHFIWDIDKNELIRETDPFTRNLLKRSQQLSITDQQDIIVANSLHQHETIHLLQKRNAFKIPLLLTDEATSDCNFLVSNNDKLVYVRNHAEIYTVRKYDLHSHNEETFCTLISKPSRITNFSENALLVSYQRKNLYIHQKNHHQFIWQCGEREEIDQIKISPDNNFVAVTTLQWVYSDRNLKLYCIHLSRPQSHAITLDKAFPRYDSYRNRIEWTKEGVLCQINNFTLTRWVIKQPALVEDREQTAVKQMPRQ